MWNARTNFPLLALGVVGLCMLIVSDAIAQPYELAFSTFFGGSAGEGIRDVETDPSGNVYIAGTTQSADFPTTLDAYDERLDTSLGTTR